jgi:hypothetical protein
MPRDQFRLHRRSLVTGMAIAAFAPTNAAPADRESDLIILGRRFDELFAAWLPLHRREQELRQQSFCMVRSGACVRSEFDGERDDETAFLMTGKQTGYSTACDQAAHAAADLDPIVDAILAAKATNLSELAAKARACRYALAWFWDRPASQLGTEAAAVIDLVEAIEALEADRSRMRASGVPA